MKLITIGKRIGLLGFSTILLFISFALHLMQIQGAKSEKDLLEAIYGLAGIIAIFGLNVGVYKLIKSGEAQD